MATTMTLTGRLADITSVALDEISAVTVKAPSYRPGPAVELTTSQPRRVDLGRDGSISIDVVEGIGWLYIEGRGWSDSIRFVASAGMSTIWEAVVNALPVVVEAKRLLAELGKKYVDMRAELLKLNATQIAALEKLVKANQKAIYDASLANRIEMDALAEEIRNLVFAQSEPNDGAVLGLLENDESATAKHLSLAAYPVKYSTNAMSGVMGADTHENIAGIPYLYDDQTIIVDETTRIIDGPQFCSIIRVGHRPGEWMDEYYAYVSGHGGYTEDALDKGYVWLLTAPSPYGPWTWREKVVGSDPSALMVSHLVGPRTSAPEAIWVGDEIHLCYHGGKLTEPWTENYDYTKRWGAPSVLATSTDGVHFTEKGIAIDVDNNITDGSPYAASTSYRRIFKENGVYHTVFQANSTNKNDQVGSSFCYSVGHAVSPDGLRWRKLSPLLGPEAGGDQGPMAPSVVRVQDGWLMVCMYRALSGGQQVPTVRFYFAKELEPGAFRSLGDVHLPDRDGRTQGPVGMPTFLVHNGIMHLLYGGRIDNSKLPVINLAKIGWR